MKLRICGKNYDVIDCERNALQTLSGEINYNKLTIHIDKTLNKQQYDDTLLHEMIHGISTTCELDLTEKQVGILSSMLYGALVDNYECFTSKLVEANDAPF